MLAEVWIMVFFFTYGYPPEYTVFHSRKACLEAAQELEYRGGDYEGVAYCWKAERGN